MAKWIRRVGAAFGEAFRGMLHHEAPKDAAAISFFSLFGLFPAILVLVAVVDAFLGWMNLHATVVQRIIALFPGSRQFLTTNLEEITDPSPHLLISCIVIVIWSSAWIFGFIENAMNKAWGVVPQRTFWESRVRGIALLVLGSILLLTSAAITAVLSAARSRAAAHMPGILREQVINWFWSCVLLGAGILIAILVFSVVYKLMPDRKVLWCEAFSGALVSAVVWEAGSYVFMKIVPYFDYQRVYGRMGAIVALLVWVYTSNLIMLFGANFSARLHRPGLGKDTGLSEPVSLAYNQERARTNVRSFRILR